MQSGLETYNYSTTFDSIIETIFGNGYGREDDCFGFGLVHHFGKFIFLKLLASGFDGFN